MQIGKKTTGEVCYLKQGMVVEPNNLCTSALATLSVTQRKSSALEGFNASDLTFQVNVTSSSAVTAEIKVVPRDTQKTIPLYQSREGIMHEFKSKSVHKLQSAGTFKADLFVNGQNCGAPPVAEALINGCQPGFTMMSGACFPDTKKTCGKMSIGQLSNLGSNQSQLNIVVNGATANPKLLLSRADASREINATSHLSHNRKWTANEQIKTGA